MSPEEFKRLGDQLYGRAWKSGVADAYDISRRSIERMAAGSIPIPADLALDLRQRTGHVPPADSADERQRSVGAVLDDILSGMEGAGWKREEVLGCMQVWLNGNLMS